MSLALRALRPIPAGAASPFARDVIAGLSSHRKMLSSKYLYDDVGSRLFEDICRLEEYYPARVETALLATIAEEIAREVPEDAVLIEFGSGASAKTRMLLDAATHMRVYVPIDISAEALSRATSSIRRDYPQIAIFPVHNDFTAAVRLPSIASHRSRVGFFPGSTIGNFTHAEAVCFMTSARALLGRDSLFILGADIVKDKTTLIRAYDDAKGVTAAFNLNLLARINRELDGNANLELFEHRAVWNEELKRIEMHLVSRADQTFSAAGSRFVFREGETIHTENSHKFTRESLADIAGKSGWKIDRYWQSPAPEFAVLLLKAA